MSALQQGVIAASDAIAQRDGFKFIFVGVGAEGERAQFDATHIPGAAFIGVREAFAGEASPQQGGFPLPSVGQLGARLAEAGVSADDAIVVYAAVPAWASRAWWVLRWAGLDASVLDGGLNAWRQAGGPLSAEADAPAALAGSLALTPGSAPEIVLEDLLAALGERPVIDARDPASFAAGHIPGAVNLPSPTLWDEEGKLRDRQAVRAALAAVGVREGDDIIAYCGGGVLATYAALALQSAGINPTIYVGSWSQWSAHPETPRAGPSAT